MSGQIWSVAAEGGYMYSDELSDVLRVKLQPLTKFRQLCDAPEDAIQKGLHKGDSYHWNVYSDLTDAANRLDETAPIPESGFTVSQKSLTIFEGGISVPYTGKLSALAKHDVVTIIDKALRNNARKFFDAEAFLQFKATKLRVAPESGTSTTAVTLTTNGATATTNNVEMGTGHVKAIGDLMKERNIPPYAMDDYICISHPTTFRTFKNSLETIKQYTDTGLSHIFSGEIGRYEGFRFIEQNFIAKGGANNSVTYNPRNATADPWDNTKSSWAFFCGQDTAVEAMSIPEEIRAKVPGDYGRSKGIAWYYLGGFGIVHDDADNSRIVMWDSAA